MPNTLAHFGVQGVATRVLMRDADPKWIALGCVLPDVPWIGRRALEVLAPGLDACDVRLYAAVQSSLLFSLVLAGALALWARRALHVDAIHGHGGRERDYASYAGLALLAAMWLSAQRAR